MKLVKFDRFVLACALFSLASQGLAAAAPSNAGESYKYPELLVVPRASQTLSRKAAEETKSPYTSHLLLQAPATLTLFAGLVASGMKEKESKNAGSIATGVGAGWLAFTVLMSATYRPYGTGLTETTGLGSKNLEQSLASERRAEEALAYPAYLMRRIQYISAFTNFGAGVAVASLEEKNSNAKLIGGMAAAAAFLPLIFTHPWISNSDQQQDYKKRIYGPLTDFTLLPDVKTGSLVPAVNFKMQF